MREEQIANGVKFLVHPKVKTAPLSQRISFLENKVKQQAVTSELSKEVACPRDAHENRPQIRCPSSLEPGVPQTLTIATLVALALSSIGVNAGRNINGAVSRGGSRRQ